MMYRRNTNRILEYLLDLEKSVSVQCYYPVKKCGNDNLKTIVTHIIRTSHYL